MKIKLIPRGIQSPRGGIVAPMLWIEPEYRPRWCVGFYGSGQRGRGCFQPVRWGEFTDWDVVREFHADFPLKEAIG